VVNAIGPETFTYLELARTVRHALGLNRPIIPVPQELGYWSCRMIGLLVRDVVITRQEIRGLMEGRLCVDAPPLGTTKLTAWIDQHRDTLGRYYTNEIARRTDRISSYHSN
jgi:NADH dehydrogenase